MTINKVTVDVEDLPDSVGREFGPSNWLTVTSEDVLTYAQVSGDDNPLHVDEEFANQTPFGGRIAHGMLTLSLVVPLLREVFKVTGLTMGINYGFNKVRFPAPVPVSAQIRLSGSITSVTAVPGGWQTELHLLFEVEGAEKPCCVADLVLRHYR